MKGSRLRGAGLRGARLKFLQHRPSPFFLSHLLPLTPPSLFPPYPPTLVGDKGGKGGFGGVGRRSKAGGEVDGGYVFWGMFGGGFLWVAVVGNRGRVALSFFKGNDGGERR